jgi:uridine kinase
MANEAAGEQPVSELLGRILRVDRKHQTLLIGIDGLGASGKSTLARALFATTAPRGVAVVAMDDFYRPSKERRTSSAEALGATFDWRRVREQVLVPLARGENARYQRYDWDGDRLADWHLVPAGGAVIIEGLYSTRPELRHFYDFTIWVQAGPEVRLARGIARDGEDSRDRWLNEWMVEEARYLEAERPADNADLIVDGSAKLDVTTRFKALRSSQRS